MSTLHQPVLGQEVLDYLAPGKNQNFIDCTVGGGGHAAKILAKTGPLGKLLGLDWDGGAIARSRERLAAYHDRLILVNSSYIHLKKIVYEQKIYPISGILFDLGLSSDQLQVSGRGFSFQVNEPLDMRYSPEENELTAAQILNDWPEEEIKKMLFENAEERSASRIAKAIGQYRKNRPLANTLELVNLIAGVMPQRHTKIHPATKTFQALRIAVNDEFNNIKIALKDSLEILEPGARLAVITFHSLEDRIVKQFFKQEAQGCVCPLELPVCRCDHQAKIKLITPKPVAPSEKEIMENWRSRSAKLRVVERIF